MSDTQPERPAAPRSTPHVLFGRKQLKSTKINFLATHRLDASVPPWSPIKTTAVCIKPKRFNLPKQSGQLPWVPWAPGSPRLICRKTWNKETSGGSSDSEGTEAKWLEGRGRAHHPGHC